MNYIKRLQKENEELRTDKKAARETLTELYSYLTSPKFHEDPTVQTADVLRRIEPARSALL